MLKAETNIFSRIRKYIKVSKDIQHALSKHPEDADRYQPVLNSTVDKIYQEITEYEKEKIAKSESVIYRLKKIFEKRYRRYFLYGEYIRWVYEKPFGYAGDFKIIDDIYRNEVHTQGFDRLWDCWFQNLAASKSVRERKDDFRKIIIDFFNQRGCEKLRIMNLACGPAREIKEILENDTRGIWRQVEFDCYDMDANALDFASKLLKNYTNVRFFQKNAVRLALKKNIENEIPAKYDLIYSTGLFDYLDESIATRLVSNLGKLLKKGGLLVISNANDKYSNPSAIWMEWIGEWYLIYRTAQEFRKIFLNAGFAGEQIEIVPQKCKVMQYALVKK